MKCHHHSCWRRHHSCRWKTPHTQLGKSHTIFLQQNQSIRNDESVASCTHAMVQCGLCLVDNKNEVALGSKAVRDDPLEGIAP